MGYPHPDHLLGLLDSRQISEWLAYYAIEPFGEQPAYLRSGIIASTIANVHRGKRGRTFRPEDFMPKEPKVTAAKVQSIEEQKSVLKQIFSWAKKKGLTKVEKPKEKK